MNLLNEDKTEYFQLFDEERILSEDSIIHSNYNYFVSRLKETSLDIEKLYDTIQGLQLVAITIEQNDNPQLIFESLTSTGLALTEGDKIRNFILMGLSSTEQVRYYNEYWSRIEKDCGNDDTSGFIRDYLSLKTQKIPNIKNVYQDFRKYWDTCEKASETILTDLRTYSHAYNKLLCASTGIKLADDAITGLTHLETTVIRPFAIEVIKLGAEGTISTEEVGRSFSIIEDYIFRRVICALPSHGLNKIFSTLANDIRKLDGTYAVYSDKLSFVLLRKQGSGRFPSDEDTWKSDLGEDWEIIHETWKNRFANLTVVASPYNSMFSNNTFAKKRDMDHGFKDSGLRVNQYIATKEKWGIEELEERSKILADKALSIWPGLVTSYQVTEEDSIQVSLDDEFDFTGRSLLSASFNGTPINATVWSDFVEIVCKMIYEMDPSGLARVAKEAESTGLDAFLSVSDADHGRRISDFIFVRTDCNTNRKLWFIRHLFEFMRLDQSSLVMNISAADAIENYADTNRRLWAYIIPKLVEATREAGCPSYQKRKPVDSYYLDGFIGCSKMHLVSSFGLKSCLVWAYLYIEGGDRAENSRIFNHFYSYKSEIEKSMGTEVKWTEPSEKARRGSILVEASVPFINDESRWDEVADVSARLMKRLVSALLPCIEDVKQMLAGSNEILNAGA